MKAGFLTEKDARKIRREQRQERKEAKKAGGFAAVEELERQKKEDLLKLREQQKQETQENQAQHEQRERKKRIQTLLRNRLSVGGNRRFFFQRPDRVIDFVDVDPDSHRKLSFQDVAIVRKPKGRPGEYYIMPKSSKLDELRGLDQDIVLYPRSA